MMGNDPERRSRRQTEALSLRRFLEAQSGRAPEAVALSAPGRPPLTYRRLREIVEGVSATLRFAGLTREDRVAICLPNGPEMAAAFLGVSAAAACAPLNPAYLAGEFEFFLSDLNARALILPEGDASPARKVARERGIPVLELAADPSGEAGSFRLSAEKRPARGGSRLPRPDDTALLLHTSGTTARPKLVALTQRNLYISARNVARALHLAETDRCLNVMPLFHVHGLVAALLASLTAGGSIFCAPGFHAPRFFEWMDEFRPTWYTAVPTMHQAILARAAANRDILEKRPLRFLRSSSSALSPRLFAELESVFESPVIEAYGMTEASHQMTSNPLPPLTRKPGSVGLPYGTELAILDGAGEPLRAGATGEVIVRGPTVMCGYENDPAANGKAYIDGWFRTGDLGYLDPEGYLFLTGRAKEIINRGGEKIAPREIDEALLEHPAVAQAVGFAVPHPELGEDVAAAVVLREGASSSEGELRAFAAARLAPFKVPRRILIVEEIPKGATGKLQRIGLAERLGWREAEPSSPIGTSAGPRTPLEESVAAIWKEVLRVERVGVADDFFALGGDSVLATQVASRVRDALGVELPLLSFLEAPTVAGLAASVQRLLAGEEGEAVESPAESARP